MTTEYRFKSVWSDGPDGKVCCPVPWCRCIFDVSAIYHDNENDFGEFVCPQCGEEESLIF